MVKVILVQDVFYDDDGFQSSTALEEHLQTTATD